MGTVRERVELGSDADRVWSFVTDPVHFPDYVAGWVDGEVTSADPAGPGSHFRWTGAFGPLRLRTEERVVEWEPGRFVEYEGETAGIHFRSSMQLDPLAPDRTALTVVVETKTPRRFGGALADGVVDRIVTSGVRASLERLTGAFGGSVAHEREALVAQYRKRAKHYDAATQLYRLAGFPLTRYRRLAAEALDLRPGATVVEIGCGTGANFPLLQERIGPTGRIIGVDLTDEMLEQAARRVAAAGWRNVELVQRDARDFDFPEGIDAILSTLALTLSPDYEDIIARGARALAPDGRWVVLDLKEPEHWPKPLVALAVALAQPYGVSLALASRRPWESIQRHLPHTTIRELYFGAIYLAIGRKRGDD